MNTNAGPHLPIRERRLAAGLSQEKLARSADCSISTIRLVEQGWTGASEAMLGRIARALKCDPSELVRDLVGAPSEADR